MNKIDAMIAPRALTALELAEVLSPNLIVYGIAHRAFIHGQTLNDDTRLEAAVVRASESALAGIVNDGLESVGQWLADMECDSPRFYRKGALKGAVEALCHAAAQEFAKADDERVARLADLITDRDPLAMSMLIEAVD